MATKRRAVVEYVGDADSLIRATRKANAAQDKFAKATAGVHAKVGSSFAGMAKRAAGAGAAMVGAYASIAGAKNAISTTQELSKTTLALHRNLGLTITEASRWAAVAKARSVDTDALNSSFTTLAKNIESAKRGNEGTVAAFKALGVTQKAVKRGSEDFSFLLGELADRFGKMEGGSRRAALAQQLLGRSSQATLPIFTAGKQAMEEQLALADKYGVTLGGKTVKSLKDLAKAQRESEFATLGLQVAFATQFAPALTKAISAVSEFVAGMREGTGAGGRFVEKLEAIRDAFAPVAKFFVDHPTLIAVAVGAWATYRVAALAALAATRLKLIGQFLGLTGRATAGGAAAGSAFGTAAAGGAGLASTASKARFAKAGLVLGVAFRAAFLSAATLGLAEYIAAAVRKAKGTKSPRAGDRSNPLSGIIDKGLGAIGLPDVIRQQGGMIPGTGRGDIVPAMLEPGEFVMRRKVVEKFGPTYFANLNAQGFQQGGPVNKDFPGLLSRVWGAVGAGFGGRPMPRTTRFKGGAHSPAIGSSEGGARLPRWAHGDLSKGRTQGLGTLLHEWAHTFQKPWVWRELQMAEGGAEAYATTMTPRVAGPLGFRGKYHPYGRYVKDMRQALSLGPEWVLDGQFNWGTSRGLRPQRMANGGLVHRAAVAAGFRGNALRIAQAVAQAESSGDPRAIGDRHLGGSHGLWQIHLPSHPNYDPQRLFDPFYNARAAFAISSGGRNWQPWTTFRTGAYRRFLGQALRGGAPRTPGRTPATTGTRRPGGLGISKGAGAGVIPGMARVVAGEETAQPDFTPGLGLDTGTAELPTTGPFRAPSGPTSGTPSRTGTTFSTMSEYVQAWIDEIDLKERAGDLTPAQAHAARRDLIIRALNGEFGPMSATDRLRLRGDLRQLDQQAAANIGPDLQAQLDQANLKARVATRAAQLSDAGLGAFRGAGDIGYGVNGMTFIQNNQMLVPGTPQQMALLAGSTVRAFDSEGARTTSVHASGV